MFNSLNLRFSLLAIRRRAAGCIAVAVLAAILPSTRAAMLATDNAGNYTTATWVNGSNLGTGFGAWAFNNSASTGTSFSGEFIGDSTAGSGNVNTGTSSFAVFANPNGAFATTSRAFSGGALTLGQTFSINLAVNFRNGSKGINLLDGTGTQVFNFNVGGDDYNYKLGTANTVSTGLGYSATSVFTISYTQQSATTGMFSIARAGDTTISQTFAASGVSSFVLYNSNTDNGDAANNLYFNNPSVVPEPSTAALVAISLTGMVVARRRR